MNTENGEVKFRNYDETDGLPGLQYHWNSNFYDTLKNEIYFGGHNGVTVINPEKVTDRIYKPPIFITQMRVNGKEKQVRHWSGGSTFDLKHWQNSITFEFAALDFAAPQNIEYAYKLLGFDDDWKIHSSDKAFAQYTNLPAGNYRFVVKATNADKIWSVVPATLNFTIAVPWWQTWWFKLILSLTLLFLVYGWMSLRERFLKSQNIKLEALVIQRTNELIMKQNEISEKNKMLLQSNEDLRQKNDEIQVMATQVEKAHKEKIQFFTSISHEFRTPLTLIVAPIHKLMKTSPSISKDVLDSMLHKMERNAQHLLGMIDEVLKIRKIEESTWDFRPEIQELAHYLKGIHAAFQPLSEETGIDFHLELTQEKVTARIDSHLLDIILNNLLSNAFKYSPKGSEVKLTLSQSEDYILLQVYNSGVGLDPEELKKIFDPYYQVRNNEYRSTGLGLALVKRLIELHKGIINVESENRDYVQFSIQIPRDIGHSLVVKNYAVEEVSSEMDEPIVALDFLTKDTRVLVVEDHRDLREMLQDELSDHCEVHLALNGSEGLKQATNLLPDLIISDVMMPVMDGYELCQAVKKEPNISHIPVILLTAMSSENDELVGLQFGADDYVTKPFHFDILLTKINNLIRHREELKRKYSSSFFIKSSELKVGTLDQEFLKKVDDLIINNLSNSDLEANFLCKALGYSRTTLYQKIKSLTGQSVNVYIRTIRLKQAAVLLRKGYNVSQSSQMVGFNSLAYFSESFKTQFGISPGSFSK